MTFSKQLRKLIEDDLAKMMGKPVINKTLWLWMVVDFFMIQLFIGPCNVLIWRGGWELYDHIFGHNLYTGIGLFFFGLFLSIPLIIYSINISMFADEILLDEAYGRGSIRYVFVTRAYSAVTFLVMLFFWKGWWDIFYDFPYFGFEENDNNPYHWYFSLGCLVIGSFILFNLGCFKTAVLTPPVGLWLDTATQYVHVDTFYNVEDEVNKSMNFRFFNAVLTLIIEVTALATYYGAFTLIDHFFHPIVDEMFGHTTYYASGFLLIWAVLLSGVSYVLSIFYLYIFYEVQSIYLNSSLKNLLYHSILVVSIFATAMHFHAWWEFTDVMKSHSFWKHSTYPEFIFLGFGFLVTVFLGVGGGNHFGIIWEKKKETDGVLLPFIYLTYILRDRDDPKSHNTDTMAVDHIVNLMEEGHSHVAESISFHSLEHK